MPATLGMSILFKGYSPVYSLFTQATSVLCPVGFTIINSVFLSHFCKRKAAIITYSASHWLSTSGAACHSQFLSIINDRFECHKTAYLQFLTIKKTLAQVERAKQDDLNNLIHNYHHHPCFSFPHMFPYRHKMRIWHFQYYQILHNFYQSPATLCF